MKIRKSLLANSVFRNFFIGAIGFFIIASAFGAYMFFAGSNTVSADNIEINILGNAFVSGGEELPLKIEIIKIPVRISLLNWYTILLNFNQKEKMIHVVRNRRLLLSIDHELQIIHL